MAEMNGWRPKMEDAHIIHMADNGGFFGVFDGHGGDDCSRFITERMKEELVAKGLPANDEIMRELAFSLDQEFLDTMRPSGTTGTFVIVELPQVDGGKHSLRIGNVGDSRVLLGKADGQMVEGPGSDGAMTTDHKPSDPGETERIIRTGGHVQIIKNVARVNGDLAVSRAFGDRSYKQTGGPGHADHPVTAEPEFLTTECDPTDFLVLVCDGISEGSFPNREVIELAAESLRQHGDPGIASAAICRRALDRKSMDNLTCMVVMLSGGELEPEEELLPGQFWDCLSHKRFKEPYAAMAQRAGHSLAQVVEKRFDLATKELRALEEQEDLGPQECWLYFSETENPTREDKIQVLREELAMFVEGPPASLAVEGSAARTEWFEAFVQSASVCADAMDPTDDFLGLTKRTVLPSDVDFSSMTPQLDGDDSPVLGKESQHPASDSVHAVRVAELEVVRPAVDAHENLEWNDKLLEVCGVVGQVVQEDSQDRTSLVRFIDQDLEAWLPVETLSPITAPFPLGTPVRVASLEAVRQAVEAHKLLTWHDKLESLCEAVGTVETEDSGDGTTYVLFGPPHELRAWLPTESLTQCDMEAPMTVNEVPVPVE